MKLKEKNSFNRAFNTNILPMLKIIKCLNYKQKKIIILSLIIIRTNYLHCAKLACDRLEEIKKLNKIISNKDDEIKALLNKNNNLIQEINYNNNKIKYKRNKTLIQENKNLFISNQELNNKLNKFNKKGTKKIPICEQYKEIIISLHNKGFSSYNISDVIKVSQKTVYNYLVTLKNGGEIN